MCVVQQEIQAQKTSTGTPEIRMQPGTAKILSVLPKKIQKEFVAQ